MNDALRYALVIEVLQLFNEYVVFKDHRAAFAGLEGILIISNHQAR
jgi:hypothetical protein